MTWIHPFSRYLNRNAGQHDPIYFGSHDVRWRDLSDYVLQQLRHRG